MLKNKNILIVEDEAMIAFDLESVVEAMGGDVVQLCQDIDSAMYAARTLDIDAAILDYDIGGHQVDPVADILQDRGIPFVFNTANIDEIKRKERFAHIPVCPKPTLFGELKKNLVALVSMNTSQKSASQT